MGNKDDALTKLISACSELIGDYAPGGDRKACRPGLRGGSYEFEIRNENVYSINISQDACVADLRREIDDCTYGGKRTDVRIFRRFVVFCLYLRGIEEPLSLTDVGGTLIRETVNTDSKDC